MTDDTTVDDGVEVTVAAFNEYAETFQTDLRERQADTSSFVEDVEQRAVELEETDERFRAFADTFAEAVDDRRRTLEAAGEGFEAYRTTFDRDVDTKRETNDVAEAVADLREEFEETAASFRGQDGGGRPTLDIEGFRTAVEEKAARFAAATEGFESDLGTHRPSDSRPGRSPEESDSSFADEADDNPTPSVSIDVEPQSESSPVDSVATDEPDDSDDHQSDSTHSEATELDFDDEAGDDAVESEDDTGSADASEDVDRDEGGAQTGDDEIDGESSPAVDELDRDELVDRLLDVQYAKLKKAANSIGYEDNLNAATKDELVEFLADNGDEIQDQLGAEGA